MSVGSSFHHWAERWWPRCGLGLAATLGCACGAETGQDRVNLPLYVAGSEIDTIDAVDGVSLQLEQAQLAFGPLYLCAGSQAGDFCETARLEWLDSVVIDVLDPEPQPAGQLQGVTGSVRSWMFDLGISSQLTQPQPVLLSAARELGDVSLVLSGRAQVGNAALPFSVRLAIQQGGTGESGLPVIAKSAGESFEHDVTVDEAGLLVRFDPSSWLADVDFSAFVQTASCGATESTTVCNDSVEQRCDSDGALLETRDCSELEMFCLADVGCVESIALEDFPQALSGVRLALEAGERPSFEWGTAP